MSKATKIWLIVAAVMIACGLILFGAALVTQGLDFAFLQGEPYELHTHPIAEPFESISIDVTPEQVGTPPKKKKNWPNERPIFLRLIKV